MSDDRLAALSRLLVTLVLMVYGFMVRETAPGVGEIIIGSVIGYWLREGQHQAQRAETRRGAPRRRAEDFTGGDE